MSTDQVHPAPQILRNGVPVGPFPNLTADDRAVLGAATGLRMDPHGQIADAPAVRDMGLFLQLDHDRAGGKLSETLSPAYVRSVIERLPRWATRRHRIALDRLLGVLERREGDYR
jgi:hypothetical protein